MTDTSAARTLEAQQIKNMLDAIGFEISIQTFESATVTSIVAGGDPNDYDIFLRAMGANPRGSVSNSILSCKATTGGNNPSWLTPDSHELAQKYDDTIMEARETIDPQVRIDKYMEVQVIERDMCMEHWLLMAENYYAMAKDLGGIAFDPSKGTVLLKNTYFIAE